MTPTDKDSDRAVTNAAAINDSESVPPTRLRAESHHPHNEGARHAAAPARAFPGASVRSRGICQTGPAGKESPVLPTKTPYPPGL